MLLHFKKLRPYSTKFDTKVCGAINGYVMEANNQHGNTLFEVKGINEVQWTIDNILNELYTKNTDARTAKKKYKTEYNDGRITVCEYYDPYTELCEVSEKVILSTNPEQLPGQTALFTPSAQSPVTVTAPEKKKEGLRTIQPEATVKDRKKRKQSRSIQPVTTVTDLKRNRKVTKQGKAGYTGNKYAAECYKKIINELPPHRNFISGFLGNCAVLREKLPAKNLNIGVEVNASVISKYWQSAPKKVKVYNLNFMDAVVSELMDLQDEPQGEVLSCLDNKDTLLYLDPPYLLSSRASGKSYYENELTDKDHTDLLTWCNRQSCMIAISHYPCELYDKMLSAPQWRKITYQVRTRKEVVTEALYMNYPAPKELHEYTWLGNDSWDRQRIKRKLSRIAGKLMELPAVERNAIIHHIKNL